MNLARREVVMSGAVAAAASSIVPLSARATADDPVVRLYHQEYLPAKEAEEAAWSRVNDVQEALIEKGRFGHPTARITHGGRRYEVRSTDDIERIWNQLLKEAVTPLPGQSTTLALQRLEKARRDVEQFRAVAANALAEAERETKNAWKEAGLHETEAHHAEADRRLAEVERRLKSTPATTPAGVAIKLRIFLEWQDLEDDDRRRFEEVLAELERMG